MASIKKQPSDVRPPMASIGGKKPSNLRSTTKKSSLLIGGGANPVLPDKYVSPVRVYDENGVDVTPLPLTVVSESLAAKRSGTHEPATPTDMMSQPSYQGTTTLGTQFGGGPGPFTRSVFQSSQVMASEYLDEGMDFIGGGAEHGVWTQSLRHEAPKEVLTEDDLVKEVVLTLSETETLWIFELVPTTVNKEQEEARIIEEQNEKYHQLCKSRIGNDLYAERGMNTFTDDPKTRQIQTDKITYQENGVTCTTWDMYDTYDEVKMKEGIQRGTEEPESFEGKDGGPAKEGEVLEGNEVKDEELEEGLEADMASIGAASAASSRMQSVAPSANASVAGSQRPGSSVAGPENNIQVVVPVKVNTSALKSEKLKQDLFYMERCVNLNTYQPKLALYRGFEVIQETLSADDAALLLAQKSGFCLERLWIYTCAITKPHNISCCAWNRKNPDIIAVGYGQFEYTEKKPGIICCWSLKNPEFPERLYHCPCGVTALAFSRQNPNLLAAGLEDGSIAVYNVMTRQPDPIVDSFDVTGRHIGAVWQISFVERDTGMSEGKSDVIVSIATDGRVIQWTIRKGFEQTELMKIKRTANKRLGKLAQDRRFEALISRYAGALCFDFWPQDTNIYLVGTHDGPIHKCSCSYNEQFLETYSGHRDPVYRVHWSPFNPDVFLSCSADWTVRLWHQERYQPVLTFTSISNQVFDCCWSPKSATLFACVKEHQLELWDLNTDVLDPVVKLNAPLNVLFTTVGFSLNSDCLLVGDSNGQVTSYRLYNLPPPTDAERLAEIITTSLSSQLENLPEGDKSVVPGEGAIKLEREYTGDDFMYD